jgi:hypothetical protein
MFDLVAKKLSLIRLCGQYTTGSTQNLARMFALTGRLKRGVDHYK